MSRVDIYISHAVQAEAMSRMRFFNNNSELLYANAKVDDTKLQNRMDTLKQEIQEANEQINTLMAQQRATKKRGEDGFNLAEYQRKMSARFPELADPRCYTHPMRPVPFEHLFVLYDNTDGLGTGLYMKERWSLPPKKRFFFPETSSWVYGWNEPSPSAEPFHGRSYHLKDCVWRKNGVAMFIRDRQVPVKTFL